MKEWYLSSELIDLADMPNSVNAVARKAKRNNWLSRKATGGGRSYEYHISNFHADAQKELYEKFATQEDKDSLGDEYSADVRFYFGAMGSKWKLTNPVPNEDSNAGKLRPLPDIQDWCDLPVFDVHAAAGAKTLINTEYKIDTLAIPKGFLTGFSVDEKKCAVIFVDGNSMYPTLEDEDKVLIDLREQLHPVKNGVYVIRIDEAVYIKRLKWNISKGVYNVISDNPDYDSFEINHDNGRDFKVIGKVVSIVMKTVL